MAGASLVTRVNGSKGGVADDGEDVDGVYPYK